MFLWKSTSRAKFLPAAQLSWMMKNSNFLQDVNIVDILTLRGEYGMSANSRFSAKYGRYYYQSTPYRDVNGMIRMGLPNSKLGPEKVEYGNIGLDFVLLGNRLGISVDLYQEKTEDMLIQKGMGVAYGYDYMYKNDGEMKTQGVEVAFNVNLFSKNQFNWALGGNVTHFKTTIKSLGGCSGKNLYFK
ncbi:MAG: TonB-dependent receptor [Odoribacter sp.]|nr:TonB-dependent receptor [Odoribacter sp.]